MLRENSETMLLLQGIAGGERVHQTVLYGGLVVGVAVVFHLATLMMIGTGIRWTNSWQTMR